MARLVREATILEKIDGTNASISIVPLEGYPAEGCVWQGDGVAVFAGSRTKWIVPGNDNYGFAGWVSRNIQDLLTLGEGTHFGEWWGSGIQRGYGLTKGDKHFSLFNTVRWCLHDQEPQIISSENATEVKYQDRLPKCCRLVPELYRGPFSTEKVEEVLQQLKENGSYAAPYDNPEGIVVYHIAGRVGFKRTLGNDGHKGVK